MTHPVDFAQVLAYASRVRWMLPVIAIACLACAGPQSERLPSRDPLPAFDPKAPMVWLVVVDGLRAETLTAYLAALQDEEWEPRWPSALARLERQGKWLVQPLNAAAALETGIGAHATLLTGRRGRRHGLVGSRFMGIRSATWVGQGAVTTTNDSLGVENTFVLTPNEPTIFQWLAKVRSAQVFLPFAELAPGLRVRPGDPDTLAAWVDGPNAAYSGPLIDRVARDAAIELLHDRAPPNLLGIGFRGVAWADDQLAALRQVDTELSALLDALERAHPKRLRGLDVVLIGASPTTELGPHPRQIDAVGVQTRLIGLAQGCYTVFEQTTFVANGRTLRIHLPRTTQARPCLDRALQAAQRQQSAWLDGAVWLGPEAVEVLITDSAMERLGASRTRRLRERLPLALDEGLADGVIFAGPAITFGSEEERAVGGIAPAAIDAAQLWISARFDARSSAALESEPIDPVDLAPTLIELVAGGPVELPNVVDPKPLEPPLLQLEDGRWSFVRAARLASPAPRVTEVQPPLGGELAEADGAAPPPLLIDGETSPLLPLEIKDLSFPCRDGRLQAQITLGPQSALAEVSFSWDSRFAEPGNRHAVLAHAVTLQEGSTTLDVEPLRDALARIKRAFSLGRRRSRAELFERFGASDFEGEPRDSFLQIVACDAWRRCQSRPLLSDRDFEALVRGCQ